MQQMHCGVLRGLKNAQMVFLWEEMDVHAALNLHMHRAAPQIIRADEIAGSREVFKMGFFGQQLSKSPWSKAALFSISLASPPMTDNDYGTKNNPSTLPSPIPCPALSENVLYECDLLSFD